MTSWGKGRKRVMFPISKRSLSLFTSIIIFTACASGGFNSVQKTNQLQPGMSYSEVVQLLGEPKTSELQDGKKVSTFWLHQEWRGNVPFDLVFSGTPAKLESWSENTEKFEANQNYLSKLAKTLEGASGNSAAAPAGPNDANLQQQIAGKWWGYSGSTERRIGLCADGTYYDFTESGYSGQSHNQYGDQTMAWGSASQNSGQGRWIINGSTQSGTIHINYSNGESGNIQYQQINDPGCLSFDGNTLCRESASCR